MCNQLSCLADVTGLNKCQACHLFMWLRFGDDVYQKLIMLPNSIAHMTVVDHVLHDNDHFKGIYEAINSSDLTLKELHDIIKQIHPSFISDFLPSVSNCVDEHAQIVKALFNAISIQFLYLNSLCTTKTLLQMVLCVDPDVDPVNLSSQAMIHFILSHEFPNRLLNNLPFHGGPHFIHLSPSFQCAKEKLSQMPTTQPSTKCFDLDHKADVLHPFFESWPHKVSDDIVQKCLLNYFNNSIWYDSGVCAVCARLIQNEPLQSIISSSPQLEILVIK